MKSSFRILAILALMVGAAAFASASAFISVDPTLSFGNTLFAPGGNGGTPVYTAFTSLSGYASGDTVSFAAVGTACFNPSSPSNNCGTSSETPVSSLPNPIIGGFVTGNNPNGPFVGGPGLTGPQQSVVLANWTALFANTFIVTSAGTGNLVIPVGATGVVFVFLDDFYPDNTSFNSTLGVNATFTAPTVPEPATYSMMLAGLGLVLAGKRFRRS